jgi:hypothetical protein
MPPDNSAQVESMRMAEAQRAREAEERKAEARKAELLGLRSSAQAGGRSSAEDYLRSQGLDVARHGGDIESKINSIMSGIAPDDPNPGSYFKDVGASVYGDIENTGRTKAGRELDTMFSPDFEMKRLPWTVDDPYLAAVEAEERAKADDTIRKMLDRGVITNTGFAAAQADIDKQSAGAKSRLNEIGTGLLGTGQQSLRDVANRGRQSASALKADQAFNASDFGSEVDRLTGEFLANLGTGIRSRLTGNLFNTAGLGTLAGAAQGAQNTPFDPAVLAGAPTEPDENKEEEQATQAPLF